LATTNSWNGSPQRELTTNPLSGMFGADHFLVNDTTYIEVKTPLDNLQVTLGGHIQTRPRPPLESTDRLVRHIGELGESLAARQRAIMLICFLYDNPGFQVKPSRHHAAVKAQVSEAIRQGVEIWQVNLRCGRNTAEMGHATPNKSLTRADAAGCQRRRWDSVSAGVGANSTLGSRSSRVVGARAGGVRLRVQFPNRRTVWVM